MSITAFFLAAALASEPTEQARLRARAERVTITRDDYGIAHIRAATDADAVFGMAYAQAEDDFNRVEVNYLTALGRLSERDGEAALWKDVRYRLWNDEVDLKARFAKAPTWLIDVTGGWADGLNHYLNTHPGAARVISRFEPWMALAFSEGSIGGDIEYVSTEGLKSFYGGAPKLAARQTRKEPQGSNGIAIGPSRTKSGAAMLLINPHTSFYFRDVVHVTSDEGLNVFGAVTWGQPFVYQGFNENAGWMHTSSGLDNRDEYAVAVEQLDGQLVYRFGEEVRPVEKRPIQIKVRKADGTMELRGVTALVTHHGPVIRSEDGKLISFSIMHRPLKALEQSFLRTKAKNLDEFMAVSERKANSSNNTVFADREGHIAYLHPQFVPMRSDEHDYRWQADGNDPTSRWGGDHEIADLPNVIDPASAYVFNVNDSPWSAAGKGTLRAKDYPRYMDQWGWNMRTDHALELLPEAHSVTIDALQDIAFDPHMSGMEIILPGLLKTLAGRADYAEVHDLLGSWDRRWAADSEATTLAVHYGEALDDRVMAGVKAMADYEAAYPRMAKASADVQLAALDAAMKKMTDLYGGWRVPWGQINRLQRNDGLITQSFSDEKISKPIPFTSAFWGSLASVGARTYPGTVKRYGTSGNSFLAIVEFLPSGPRARAVTVGGVSNDPTSPFFDNQDAAWLAGEMLPVRFTDQEVARHAIATYHPGEEWKK